MKINLSLPTIILLLFLPLIAYPENSLWETIIIHNIAGGTMKTSDLKSDKMGNLYVLGSYAPSGLSDVHLNLQRSMDQGKTWQSLDDFSIPSNFLEPKKFFIDDRNNFYLTGLSFPQNDLFFGK